MILLIYFDAIKNLGLSTKVLPLRYLLFEYTGLPVTCTYLANLDGNIFLR